MNPPMTTRSFAGHVGTFFRLLRDPYLEYFIRIKIIRCENKFWRVRPRQGFDLLNQMFITFQKTDWKNLPELAANKPLEACVVICINAETPAFFRV